MIGIGDLDQELVDQSGMYVYIRVKCHNYFLFLDLSTYDIVLLVSQTVMDYN